MLPYNKLCNLEDFGDLDLAATMRDVLLHISNGKPSYPKGHEHRKHWEIAMAVRSLRDHGALHQDARILGVGAGTEPTLFYLANHVKKVVATDLYGGEAWQNTTPSAMLTRPEEFAPYPYRHDHLQVVSMDARDLLFPSNSFDGIFSSSSIEHFGTWADIGKAASEMGRVLKKGGVLTLSTEFKILGNGDGWDGQRFFDDKSLSHYLIEPSGLRLVDPLSTVLSSATLATNYPIAYAIDPSKAPSEWSEHPHIVLNDEQGYTFTSVHLTLVKG